MPFAGFPDFKGCVAANGDKDNPQAFCAWLEKQTTGNHSQDMTMGLPAEVVSSFWQAFDSSMEKSKNEAEAIDFASEAASAMGWVRKGQGWSRKAAHKVETRSVYGVPIFAVGTHNGDKYSQKDLQNLVDAHQELAGRLDPPVKIGHTSDEFNSNLAQKMGIAPEFVSGEKGNGVMAFGWVSGLRISGNVLYADLVDVPEPVAQLIDCKSYNKVSAEILFDFKDQGKTYPMALSGLALLGADIPAVKDSGLETAAVYQMAEAGKAVEYEEADMDLSESIQAKFAELGDLVKRAFAGTGKNNEVPPEVKNKEEEKLNKDIYTLLKLKDDAKEEEVVAAIKKLAEVPPFVPGGDAPGGAGTGLAAIAAKLGLPPTATMEEIMAAMDKMMGGMGADTAQMKQFKDELTALKADNAKLTRESRLAHFRDIASGLHAISGKPEDLAAELHKLEETAGAEAAGKVVATYQELNKRMVAAGIFKAHGTPQVGDLTDDDHEFVKEIKKYMAEKHVDEPTAQAALRKEKPDLFKKYMAERRIVVRTAEEE